MCKWFRNINDFEILYRFSSLIISGLLHILAILYNILDYLPLLTLPVSLSAQEIIKIPVLRKYQHFNNTIYHTYSGNNNAIFRINDSRLVQHVQERGEILEDVRRVQIFLQQHWIRCGHQRCNGRFSRYHQVQQRSKILLLHRHHELRVGICDHRCEDPARHSWIRIWGEPAEMIEFIIQKSFSKYLWG